MCFLDVLSKSSTIVVATFLDTFKIIDSISFQLVSGHVPSPVL